MNTDQRGIIKTYYAVGRVFSFDYNLIIKVTESNNDIRIINVHIEKLCYNPQKMLYKMGFVQCLDWTKTVTVKILFFAF